MENNWLNLMHLSENEYDTKNDSPDIIRQKEIFNELFNYLLKGVMKY